MKFKVTEWPKEDYGQFYEGDSYIILNTYKEEGSEALLYDVHFWIGRYSTQDEYGTAAYKTVELDTYLDDVPIQHREVQQHESELFKSYFKSITYLKGGADSGFRQVTPEEYKTRLFHFHGDRKGVEIIQIACDKSKLDSTDVYILDTGRMIYQWNGNGANKDERFRAMQYVGDLLNDRNGKARKEVLDQDSTDPDHEFYRSIEAGLEEDDVDQSSDFEETSDDTKNLFRLSDASGKLDFSKTKSGSISKYDFDTNDVFILDTVKELFVWVGKGTTMNEKKNALTYAHVYLQSTKHPLIPVSCFQEGKKEPQKFVAALAA